MGATERSSLCGVNRQLTHRAHSCQLALGHHFPLTPEHIVVYIQTNWSRECVCVCVCAGVRALRVCLCARAAQVENPNATVHEGIPQSISTFQQNTQPSSAFLGSSQCLSGETRPIKLINLRTVVFSSLLVSSGLCSQELGRCW